MQSLWSNSQSDQRWPCPWPLLRRAVPCSSSCVCVCVCDSHTLISYPIKGKNWGRHIPLGHKLRRWHSLLVAGPEPAHTHTLPHLPYTHWQCQYPAVGSANFARKDLSKIVHIARFKWELWDLRFFLQRFKPRAMWPMQCTNKTVYGGTNNGGVIFISVSCPSDGTPLIPYKNVSISVECFNLSCLIWDVTELCMALKKWN